MWPSTLRPSLSSAWALFWPSCFAIARHIVSGVVTWRMYRLIRYVDGAIARLDAASRSLAALCLDDKTSPEPQASTVASAMVYDKPLLRLTTSDTVQDAMHSMHEQGARYTIVSKEEDDSALLGVVDVPSLMRYALSPRSTDASVRRAVRHCPCVDHVESVWSIVRFMVEGSRCVAVRHRDGTLSLSSQRLVIRRLIDSDEVPMRCLTSTLGELDLGTECDVITCADTFKASEAFFMMCAYDITSLPIVDSEGCICGVIGASDLLNVGFDTSRLAAPVLEFVDESRTAACVNRCVDDVVTCRSTDTLRDVLDTMMRECVHHIYIVSPVGVPTSVVSFVDVLRVLFSQSGPQPSVPKMLTH